MKDQKYKITKTKELKLKQRFIFIEKHIKKQLKKMNVKSKIGDFDSTKKQILYKIIKENEFLNKHILYLMEEQEDPKISVNCTDFIADLTNIVVGKKPQNDTQTAVKNTVNAKGNEEFEAETTEKRNRKGQRQRRLEWEQKYGNDAKHLQKEKLHPSWEAKKRQKIVTDVKPTKITFE